MITAQTLRFYREEEPLHTLRKRGPSGNALKIPFPEN
jgi:hypothetical protein